MGTAHLGSERVGTGANPYRVQWGWRAAGSGVSVGGASAAVVHWPSMIYGSRNLTSDELRGIIDSVF